MSNGSDPKLAAFRDELKYCVPYCYAGTPNVGAAGVAADFVVVDLVAEVCTGGDISEAMKKAERRAKHFYG